MTIEQKKEWLKKRSEHYSGADRFSDELTERLYKECQLWDDLMRLKKNVLEQVTIAYAAKVGAGDMDKMMQIFENPDKKEITVQFRDLEAAFDDCMKNHMIWGIAEYQLPSYDGIVFLG